MLCTTFLLDEGWVDEADFHLVFGGVNKDALTLKIITLGLHQVLTLAAVLWGPDFVGRRFVLVSEGEGRLIWILRVLKPFRQIFVEGRHVLPVKIVQCGNLLNAENSNIYLDLGEYLVWDWLLRLSH